MAAAVATPSALQVFNHDDDDDEDDDDDDEDDDDDDDADDDDNFEQPSYGCRCSHPICIAGIIMIMMTVNSKILIWMDNCCYILFYSLRTCWK